MPPPLVGEALAFRDVFQQTQISFIENETSPSSSLRSMPPLLAGEALASRHVFDDFAAAPFGFIGDETSLPRAPTLGELARQRLRGQAR